MWFSKVLTLALASGCLAKVYQPSRRHHTSHGWQPVGQIPDGQLQAPSALPLSSILSGSVAVPSSPIVSHISNSQIQVTSTSTHVVSPPLQSLPPAHAPSVQPSLPVQSSPLGQSPPSMQAASSLIHPQPSTPVVQISDGQPQVSKVTSQSASSQAFTHITSVASAPSQVPTAAPAPGPSGGGSIVTQISDGQPQAPTAPTIVASAPSSTLTTSGTAHLAPSATFATAAGLRLQPVNGLSQHALAVGLAYLAWCI